MPNLVVFFPDYNDLKVISYDKKYEIGKKILVRRIKNRKEEQAIVKFEGTIEDCHKYVERQQLVEIDSIQDFSPKTIAEKSTKKELVANHFKQTTAQKNQIKSLEGRVQELENDIEVMQKDYDDLLSKFNAKNEKLHQTETRFNILKDLLEEVKAEVIRLSNQSPIQPIPVRNISEEILLPPHMVIPVNRVGYAQAATGSATAFVRRLVTLVFEFDEVMQATLKGKRASLKRNSEGQEKIKKCLDPMKVEQILDAANHRYPDQMRANLLDAIGNQVSKINGGALTLTEAKFFKGFDLGRYEELTKKRHPNLAEMGEEED